MAVRTQHCLKLINFECWFVPNGCLYPRWLEIWKEKIALMMATGTAMITMQVVVVVDSDGSDSDNVKRKRNSATTSTGTRNKRKRKLKVRKAQMSYSISSVSGEEWKGFCFSPLASNSHHFASTDWDYENNVKKKNKNLWKVKWDDRKHEFFHKYTHTWKCTNIFSDKDKARHSQMLLRARPRVCLCVCAQYK